jgi:hypothetical protein
VTSGPHQLSGDFFVQAELCAALDLISVASCAWADARTASRQLEAGSELAAEDHARACGRHDELLWHVSLDCHHGAEASAMHGNQVVRVDLLQGFHGLGNDFIRIRGQVPPANHGVDFLDPSEPLDLAD